MTEDDEDFKNKNYCRFCEKEIISNKVKDHFHLTGTYRGPAYKNCNINVTQNQSVSIPIVFHILIMIVT